MKEEEKKANIGKVVEENMMRVRKKKFFLIFLNFLRTYSN